MKKIILAGLLATTLMIPVAAMAQERDGREQHKDHGRGPGGGGNGGPQAQAPAPTPAPTPAPAPRERRDDQARAQAQQAQVQAQQAQAQARQAQTQAQQAQAQQAQAQRQSPRGGNDGRFDNGGRGNRDFRAPQATAPAQVPQVQAQVRPDGRNQEAWRGQQPNVRNDNGGRRDDNNARRDDNARRGNDGRPGWNQGNQGQNNPNWNNRNDGRRLNDRDRWNDQRRWNNNWRNDNRYDWQRYRTYNRNLFHVPRYNVPYGWSYGYQRFSTGLFMNDLLFGNQYWIDDPFYYHLPPAYGSLRWVRYYDDALLVDTRDGYVVDVIYDFFW